MDKNQIEITGIVGTHKERSAWLDEFEAWLESRGEWFGGSVETESDE